uniref:Uncharacterized protein n=1 Tax=Glossina austeni TaxID=7395 RepID=A0A1A9UN80_GLOAU
MAIPSQSQSTRNSSKKTVPKKRQIKPNTHRASNSLSHEKALNPNNNTSPRFDNDRINMQEEYNKMIRNVHKNITEENCKPVLLCCTDNSRSNNQCTCPKPEPHVSPKSEPYASPKPEPPRDSDKAPCTPCYCTSSKSNPFSKKLFGRGRKVDTTPSDIICKKASATICSTGWRHFHEASLPARGPKKQKVIRTSCGCGNFLCGCKTILPGQQQQQQRVKQNICDCPATIKVTKPEQPPPLAVIREEPEVSDKRSDKSYPPKQIEDYCADFLSIVHDNILESVRQSIDGGLRDYCMLTANKVDNLGTKLERNDEKLEMLYTDTRRNEEKLEKLYNDTMEKMTEQSDNNLRQFRLLLEFISDIQNKKEEESKSAFTIPKERKEESRYSFTIPKERSATRINESTSELSRIPENRSATRILETDCSTVEDKEMQCCIINDSKEDMKPKKMCCFAVDAQNDGRPRKCFCCKFVMNDDLNELMSSGSTEFDGSGPRANLKQNASTLGRKKSCLRNCGKAKCYCNDLDSPSVSQNAYGFNRRLKDQLDDNVYDGRGRETAKRESAGYTSSLIEITPTRRKYVCAGVGTDNSDLTRYYCNEKKCDDQDTSGYVSDRDEQEYEKCSRKKIAKKTKSGQIVLTDSASVTCVCRQTDRKPSSALRTTISDTSVGEDGFAPQKHKTVVHKYSETNPRTRSK